MNLVKTIVLAALVGALTVACSSSGDAEPGSQASSADLAARATLRSARIPRSALRALHGVIASGKIDGLTTNDAAAAIEYAKRRFPRYAAELEQLDAAGTLSLLEHMRELARTSSAEDFATDLDREISEDRGRVGETHTNSAAFYAGLVGVGFLVWCFGYSDGCTLWMCNNILC